MRLRYDNSIAADARPLVLRQASLRVEIHIRKDPDHSATLLAFSGREQQPPAKTIQQGPYQDLQQAIAAKRAIAAQLKDAGFVVCEQEHPLWSMAVQRSVNASREEKQAQALDYSFKPEDVYLDW